MAYKMKVGEYPKAYVKITKIVGSKPNFSFYVKAYKDSECKEFICDIKNEEEGSNLFGIKINANGKSYHSQCYDFLNTLNQFKNAERC